MTRSGIPFYYRHSVKFVDLVEANLPLKDTWAEEEKCPENPAVLARTPPALERVVPTVEPRPQSARKAPPAIRCSFDRVKEVYLISIGWGILFPQWNCIVFGSGLVILLSLDSWACQSSDRKRIEDSLVRKNCGPASCWSVIFLDQNSLRLYPRGLATFGNIFFTFFCNNCSK